MLNINATHDVSVSLTKVTGRHTFKAGFYNNHSYKAQNRAAARPFGHAQLRATTRNNPLDSRLRLRQRGARHLHARITQASKFVEGSYIYNNPEGYIQDNWKVNNRLTLDYGMRFVHQQPQYDKLGQASNFFPDEWTPAQAPLLYVAGCAERREPVLGHQPAGAWTR